MRNWLLVIAGILLLAAAALQWTGIWNPVAPNLGDATLGDGDRPADTSGSSSGTFGTQIGEQPQKSLVSGMVPPIDFNAMEGPMDQLQRALQRLKDSGYGEAHHHGHGGHGHPTVDPHSMAGRIASGSDFSHDLRATFEAHGQQLCASGCAASRHPTPELTKKHFHQLMQQFALEPMDQSSFALESLLFFGRQTSLFLQSEGTAPLDAPRTDLLREQLKVTHAMIEIRLVDEYGEVRTWLPPTRVPLDRRHVFDMEVKRLQPLITSGTVKRVGLYHLWTRL